MTDREGNSGRAVETVVTFEVPVDLAMTCGPVAWAGERWPNERWSGGRFWWVGYEDGRLAARIVSPHPAGLSVTGVGDPDIDRAWVGRVILPLDPNSLPNAADSVVARLSTRWRGMGALCYGSLFAGAVMSIVGQSISVAAAAVAARRLSGLFHPGQLHGERTMWPLPSWSDLAAADPAFVRRSGVTTRRAETLVALGRAFADGKIDDLPPLGPETEEAAARLLAMPGIGPWTVASALLWGLGRPDAFPPGDAALLRAARRAYDEPGMDHRRLDRLSDGWRPARGVAARLLWLDLFGPAPEEG